MEVKCLWTVAIEILKAINNINSKFMKCVFNARKTSKSLTAPNP